MVGRVARALAPADMNGYVIQRPIELPYEQYVLRYWKPTMGLFLCKAFRIINTEVLPKLAGALPVNLEGGNVFHH